MLDEFWPDPQSFCAGVDGGSYLEAVVLVEENSIQDVAFACSVLADYGHDGDVFFLVGFHEPVYGFLVDDDFWVRVGVRLCWSKETSWIGFMGLMWSLNVYNRAKYIPHKPIALIFTAQSSKLSKGVPFPPNHQNI